jgi:hypothetical protein
MPAEGQPIDSRGGAPGNEPAYPRAGAPAHETDPICKNFRNDIRCKTFFLVALNSRR